MSSFTIDRKGCLVWFKSATEARDFSFKEDVDFEDEFLFSARLTLTLLVGMIVW